MSKSGHLLTAAALAYAVYERSASPTLALRTLLGSSFPDIGEFVQFRGKWRTSLIPHRTLTHWIPLYVLVLAVMHYAAQSLPWWSANLISDVCFGSILHITLDLFSPCGISLLHPFGARRSLGLKRGGGGKPCLYRTGTAEELPVIAAAVLGIVAFAPYPPPSSFHTFEAQNLTLIESLVRAVRGASINVARYMGAVS